ncbi:MAG: HipA family kinase [Limisphaerales bacterium]
MPSWTAASKEKSDVGTCNRTCFHRPMGVGKTAPSLITCVQPDGSHVELVVKFAGGCEGGTGSLLREAVAALMAADLDLPVPQPFQVSLGPDFVATIPDADERYRVAKKNATASLGWNFGSRKIPAGFSTLLKGQAISRVLLPAAAEILAFDTFVANPDRTVANPNCQSNGREFAIYDHEMAFRTEGVLFWKPPWEKGGILFSKTQPDGLRHVFVRDLRGTEPDFSRFGGAFDVLTDARMDEYHSALPVEWLGDGSDIQRILEYKAAMPAPSAGAPSAGCPRPFPAWTATISSA